MSKVFASDYELENVKVYVVTRMIHDYTPSHYVESTSKYTDKELAGLIYEDITKYYKKKLQTILSIQLQKEAIK